MMPFNYDYIYLGDRSKARTNVITIAYCIEKAEFNDTRLNVDVVRFGVAFSNKKDVYNKTLGKKLAMYRCNGMPYRYFNTKLGVYHSILSGLQKQELPGWAYDMIECYLIDKFIK